MTATRATTAVIAVVLLFVSACARPVTGVPTATGPTTVQPPATVVVPPATVYVAPPATVTVPPVTPTLTPCQRLHADGHTYAVAYTAWEQAGYPANWDADHDGLPCEQSYGEQN
jgi:hypothetical protein